MTASALALTVILAIVLLGSVVGFYAGSRYKMDLEQWTVAGRGFGVLLACRPWEFSAMIALKKRKS